MDLLNVAVSQDSFALELTHPKTGFVLKDKADEVNDDGDIIKAGTPFTISVLSSDTNKSKNAMHYLLKEAREKGKKSKSEMTKQEEYAMQCRAVAKLTTDCFLILDGKPIKHSEDAMFELLVDPRFTWIKDQVTAAVDDRSNFILG